MMIEEASDQPSSPLPEEKTKRRKRKKKVLPIVDDVDEEAWEKEKKDTKTRKTRVTQKADNEANASLDFRADMQSAQRLEAQKQQDPQVNARLIRVYKRILRKIQPDEDPLLYASIQHKLGDAYSDLEPGDLTGNLKRAIACYQEALHYRTPDLAPLDYADTQKNLGNAYKDLQTGNQFANLTQAIACYQEAMRYRTPETAPLDYAKVQYNLGETYGALPTGDRTANLERAIACYQEAMRYWTPETAPLDYADAVSSLGQAYSNLPIGDRTANLERAIACYQEALRYWTPETAPLDYALAQRLLGSAYWQLGEQAVNLERAIACYQEALRFQTPEISPLGYADTQTDLGNAYCDLQTGDRTANLERAIACYQEALRFQTPELAPLDYARIQHCLGNAYWDLPTGDQTANLRQAITHYQEALRFWTAENVPLDYATVQVGLGNTYSDLQTGDRTANLRQAITHYQEALRFWTAENVPLDYALIQYVLGNTYWELPTGDRTTNLRQSIAHHKEALRFWTAESVPLDYAKVQVGLGNAYIFLQAGDRATNLKQAIMHYQEALRFWTAESMPLDYALAHNNMGDAYLYLLAGDREANLRQAIMHYQEALCFWTLGITPFDYARAQFGLGLAYTDLFAEDRAANLKRAITHYQEALRFWTAESMPLDYATIQAGLGNAYRDLLAGDRIVNLKQAIVHYQEALRYQTPEAAPLECRKTNRNLGDLHLDQGEWHAALSAYRVAMSVGERLYQSGLTIESKTTEVAENSILYRHAAFAAVRCGEIQEALLILEQGKTRLFTEALRLRVQQPANIPQEIWSAFEDAKAAVRNTLSERTTMAGEGLDLVQAYIAREQEVRSANTALDNAIKQVRLYAPDFLRPIELPVIQALLPDERTVIVTFCITMYGSMGFIVSAKHDQAVRVVEVPNFTQSKLHHLFVQRSKDGSDIGGWLGAYRSFIQELSVDAFDTWQMTITHVLAELGQHLLTPILSSLSSSIEQIIVLPSAELFLFPLHAVPISDDESECVCDRYQVGYAPSLEVLVNTRVKVEQEVIPTLYGVINPQDDPRLVFTTIEGSAIAKLFEQGNIDEGPSGTKQHVVAGMRERSYVHFACHGSYDWDNPAESGLNLADGRLTLAELQRGEINLTALRLITLSACETGLIDVIHGSAEEYVGIPAGFLLVGVPCVVSSLWAVPDLSTALLMGRFYNNHLSRGMNFSAALQDAQLWLRDISVGKVAQYAEQWYQQAKQDIKSELFRYMRYYRYQAEYNQTLCPFAHPYYWAGFTVNGL